MTTRAGGLPFVSEGASASDPAAFSPARRGGLPGALSANLRVRGSYETADLFASAAAVTLQTLAGGTQSNVNASLLVDRVG